MRKVWLNPNYEISLGTFQVVPIFGLAQLAPRERFCWQGRFFLSVGSIASLCGVPWVMPGKTQMAVRLRPYRILPAELNGHTRKTISDYASAGRLCLPVRENPGENGTRELLRTCLSVLVGQADSLKLSHGR